MLQTRKKGTLFFLENHEQMRVNLKICFVWALLAVLLSYNLDLECFLETDGPCQSVCQTSGEDLCLEPSIGSSPPALLPSSFVFRVVSVGVISKVAYHYSDLDLPRSQTLKGTFGLRAPPIFA
jgi:hypothetical protein